MALFGFKGTKKTEPIQEQKHSLEMHTFNRPTQWGSDWKYDYSKPNINIRANGQYVPFGNDNAYPKILLDMYYSSPFHAAIIDFKNNALAGNGYEITTIDSSLDTKISKERAQLIMNDDWLWSFVMEYLIHQRVNILVTKKADRVVNVQVIGADEIRDSSDGLGYWRCDDWIRYKNKMEYIQKYDKLSNTEKQLLVFQRLGPGQRVYTIPQYATAANWIWLDGQIAFFQKQNIENSINPSAIINFFEPVTNEAEKQSFIDNLQLSYSSAKNAGKIMTFFSRSKETAPEVIISEPNKLDKSFAVSQENIIKNVAYAHLINPAIMGISPAGQLGATQQLIDAYSIFNSNYLIPTQKMLDNYLTQVVNILSVKGFVKLNQNNSAI